MNKKPQWMGVGIALGAGIGAALGAATGMMGAWLPIGTGIGIVLGSSLGARKFGESPEAKGPSANTTYKLRSDN